MNNTLLNNINKLTTLKYTENGALASKSSLDATLDLFGLIGALRGRSDEDIIALFSKAYDENETIALKCMFYARDILEGLGERHIFRVLLKYMAEYHTEKMKENMIYIRDFGRFDDYYAFAYTNLERQAFKILKDQFDKDMDNMKNNKPVSLLAKWLKSVNASSDESRRLAHLTMRYFGMDAKTYRTALSALRNYIDVTEVKMSEKKFSDIAFSTVPSVCMQRNNESFKRHAKKEFAAYLEAVRNNKAKINAKTLYPYNLTEKYMNNHVRKEDEVTELQWKALPNFVTKDKNFLVMADVSGSMEGTPMAISTSLAIYFAERNKGIFENCYMTFTDKPRLVEISKDTSLRQKVYEVMEEVGFSTDLERAFKVILNAAVMGKCSQEELPEALIVISDMEINQIQNSKKGVLSFTDEMERRFNKYGYKMPAIVYWNVNARNDTFLGDVNNKHVRFVSGASASVFKNLCEYLGNNPYELMEKTLSSKRYAMIH